MADNVTKLPIKDDAAAIAAAFRTLRRHRRTQRFARLRRECANDNRSVKK